MTAATLLALLPYLLLVHAAPSKRCTATITSYSDVAAAVSSKCTTINVQPFTVPAGKTFDLSNLASGTTVNIQGEVTFAGLKGGWPGPLFRLSGSSVTLNGNGNTFNGNGQVYWDGYGSNSKTNVKPKFMHIGNSGTIRDLTLLNTPVQAFSISASNLIVDNVTINNKAGYALGSNGLPLAHNTDCFDVEGTSVTVQNSVCYNQDDCLAINKGADIHFLKNYCSGGHGISIGSIASGAVVKGVTITGNTVVNSMNGLRIKTIAGATGGSVSDVTYTSNTVSGISQYGVDVQQDYENGSPTGSPTNGITISNINFPSGNTVSVNSGAKEVYVLCGSGSCQGTWDWSGLKTSGGNPGSISPSDVPITGYRLA